MWLDLLYSNFHVKEFNYELRHLTKNIVKLSSF